MAIAQPRIARAAKGRAIMATTTSKMRFITWATWRREEFLTGLTVDSSHSSARSNDRESLIAGHIRTGQLLNGHGDPIVRTLTTGYEARMKNGVSSDPGDLVGVAVPSEPQRLPERGRDRVQFFDCLRAIAISVVVLAHYRHYVFPGGAIGVSIFFALSGYLITSILLAEPVLDWHSAWRFIVRRFLRVWPPDPAAALMILVPMFLAVQVLQRLERTPTSMGRSRPV